MYQLLPSHPEASADGQRQFRFGVTSSGPFLEQWQLECIRNLEKSYATLELILAVEPSGSRESPGMRKRISGERQLKRLDETSPKAPVLIGHEEYGHCQFKPDDTQRAVQSKLDFILHFASGKLPEELHTSTRYGVWAYKFGRPNSWPECFWEVYHDSPITTAVLEEVHPSPTQSRILWRGNYRTIRSSYRKNLDQVLAASTDWPAKICIRIRNGDLEWEPASQENPENVETRRAPSSLQTLFLSFKTFKRRAQSALRTTFRYTTWNVGIVESPIQSFLSQDFRPKVRWLPESRKAHIQADPFGREKDGKVQVLFERLDYFHRKGIICTVDLNNGSQIPEPIVVIQEPVHMSYPYLFEHDGQTYCIPETNQAREVAVYRAVSFPTQWEKTGRTLLTDIRAIDTTVFENNGLWWLTCTDRERGGDANLYVWYSDNVWGPWTPHPLNPVKTDVRSARPGGTPFEHEGKLYRPAQDCSRTGGGQLVLNRVDRLTPTCFTEVPVATIQPFQDSVYNAGMHTLSAAGGYTLVDGKRFRFVPSGLLSNIARGIGKLRRQPKRDY